VLGVEIDDAAGGSNQAARRRSGRRKWGVLGALGGIVIAAILLAHPPWAVAPDEPTVTSAVAHSETPSVPDPAAPSPPPAAAKAMVEISLDSNPQDAQVIREESGELVGRTPLTIKLPLAHDVISFRFEKPGHAPVNYKVIPDLDKSIRAELPIQPAAPSEPKHVAVSPHKPARGHVATPAREARPSPPAENAAPAAEQPRSCLLSVGSFPWADLWIDGKDTGQRTPVVHYPVACGAHKLGLKRRDLRLDRTEHVTVAPGHELKQHYELSDEYGD